MLVHQRVNHAKTLVPCATGLFSLEHAFLIWHAHDTMGLGLGPARLNPGFSLEATLAFHLAPTLVKSGTPLRPALLPRIFLGSTCTSAPKASRLSKISGSPGSPAASEEGGAPGARQRRWCGSRLQVDFKKQQVIPRNIHFGGLRLKDGSFSKISSLALLSASYSAAQ